MSLINAKSGRVIMLILGITVALICMVLFFMRREEVQSRAWRVAGRTIAANAPTIHVPNGSKRWKAA